MLTPRKNCIIVKRNATKHDGVIEVANKLERNEGTVVYVGREILDISPGDSVVYVEHTGQPIHHEGQTLYVVDELDVAAVLVK